jgi:hypothetical protein
VGTVNTTPTCAPRAALQSPGTVQANTWGHGKFFQYIYKKYIVDLDHFHKAAFCLQSKMSSPNTIVTLATTISETTATINAYLTSHGLPIPSFDVSGRLGSQYRPKKKKL